MNVYTMSAFDENDDDDDILSKIGGDKSKLNEGNDVLAYESVDDFVGNTTVAGVQEFQRIVMTHHQD